MKATVRRVKQSFGWAWRAEAELEPGNVFSRYREFFSEWRDAIKWALRPCTFHTGIEELRSQNVALRERYAELAATVRQLRDINVRPGISLSYVEQVEQQRDRALERNADLEAQLLLARKILWLGHGHVGLYGDDGEMQCGMGGCIIDYKREPLPEILDRLLKQFSTDRRQRDRALSELAEARKDT